MEHDECVVVEVNNLYFGILLCFSIELTQAIPSSFICPDQMRSCTPTLLTAMSYPVAVILSYYDIVNLLSVVTAVFVSSIVAQVMKWTMRFLRLQCYSRHLWLLGCEAVDLVLPNDG